MKLATGTLASSLLAATLFVQTAPVAAAPGDQPVAPVPAGKVREDKTRMRTASLPARGLFVGDQLSAATKARLTDMIIDALGLRIEVALLVPVGPWHIDGGGHSDTDLTTARLRALRKFLTDRGIEPRHIFVETRADPKLTEARLDVQLVGAPASD